MLMRMNLYSFACIVMLAASPAIALAQTMCPGKQFATLIDETAASLRSLNADSERRFSQKLQSVAKEQRWDQARTASRAALAMEDPELSRYNAEIEQLVTQIDALSVNAGKDVPCERVSELKRVRDKLLSVMGQKSGFMLAGLDREEDPAPPGQTGSVSEDQIAAVQPGRYEAEPVIIEPYGRGEAQKSAQSAEARPPAPPAAEPQPQPQPQQQKPATKQPPAWSADISKEADQPNTGNARLPSMAQRQAALQERQPLAPPSGQRTDALPLPEPKSQTPSPWETQAYSDQRASPAATGYTMQEIREASGGVFGTLTSELAGVLNYAFKQYGSPNAYIIGDEGGGAFLAGLRYGKGELHARIDGQDLPVSKIHWQGPSVGLDFGATGSRTLFLVYNLENTGDLHKRFTGVDGSAYVAGGFGLTVLKSGKTIIVPVRTGLGLRIGASLAYVKFTERGSWNPF
jgi:hypothetical protein